MFLYHVAAIVRIDIVISVRKNRALAGENETRSSTNGVNESMYTMGHSKDL